MYFIIIFCIKTSNKFYINAKTELLINKQFDQEIYSHWFMSGLVSTSLTITLFLWTDTKRAGKHSGEDDSSFSSNQFDTDANKYARRPANQWFAQVVG